VKLAGDAEPSRVQILLASDGAVTRATGRLSLEGVDPVAVSRVRGYGEDDFSSGKPASAAFTIEATEKGGLQSTRIMMSGVTGKVNVGERDVTIGGLSVDAVYDPATRLVTLHSLDVQSDLVAGVFTGTLDISGIAAGDTSKAMPVKLSGTNFSLGLMPVFESPWPFESAEIEANLSPDLQRVSIANAKAITGGLTATGSGEVWLDGPPEARQVGVKITALGEGVITPQQVVAFWPVNLGAGARGWVEDHIPTAKASKALLKVDWPPGANAQGFLPNEHLTLDFTVQDATVHFLDDFPPVMGVSGTGHLEGNSLVVTVTGGRMNDWVVDEGKITLPQFAPKGAMMDISVMGRGDLGQMMRVLDQSNLEVGTRYGLQVQQMAGTGGLDIHVQRPMLDTVSQSDILYTIKGGFRGAAAPNIAAGFGLTQPPWRRPVWTRTSSCSATARTMSCCRGTSSMAA
jgi:hypothetical protein